MTIGVGVQGDGWAVIGSDSLHRVDKSMKLVTSSFADRKIQRWGDKTYVIWAGHKFEPRASIIAEPLPEDPAAAADAIYLRVRFAAARLENDNPIGSAIVLTGNPPQIVRVTVDENTQARPGRILDTVGNSGSFSSLDSEAVGRRIALRWLSLAVSVPGWQGEFVDYPLHVLSVGPAGVVEELIEAERDLPSDLPTMGVQETT